MKFLFHKFLKNLCVTVAATMLLVSSQLVLADSTRTIDREVDAALVTLYETIPSAKVLADKSSGVLIFPSIVKGGFIFAGQYGKGALRKGSTTAGYYKSTAISFGLQAGAQKFGYALIFMSDKDLDYLNRSSGWEVGSAPSLVLFDAGISKSLSTTTIKSGIYVFFFGQKGLMAGLSLQGAKITQIHPDKKDWH